MKYKVIKEYDNDYNFVTVVPNEELEKRNDTLGYLCEDDELPYWVHVCNINIKDFDEYFEVIE